MPQHNHTLAIQHGETLPSFAGSAEAEQHYYAHRDTYLTLLSAAATHHSSFQFDYSPESLRQLERWYFNLYETDSFQIIGLDRESFEIGMSFYFGETTVRNAQAQWIVEPYFLVPNKYTFGVRKGSFTMMLSRFTDHFCEPNNKKRESLFRRYKKYFAQTPVSNLDKKLRALVRQKKVISAITLYQQQKQCSLDEARRYIESL